MPSPSSRSRETTLCYAGIYPLRFPRDVVYLRGLESAGIQLIECIDTTSSLKKYWNIGKKLWRERAHCDVVFVLYLSALVVPVARLISSRKIIYNALNSMYEGVVLEREQHKPFSPRAILYWLTDFISFHTAHITLVESHHQRDFISKRFFVPRRKLVRVWTSADERNFFPDETIAPAPKFTVMFRGQFAPFVGIEHVIESARLLKEEDIDFIIMGWGMLTSEVQQKIKEYKLNRVRLITDFLPFDDMRKLMLSSHISLGQFGDHPRATRTIANKTFEALAVGMPFITAKLPANEELLTHRVNALLVEPANGKALADAILELKTHENERKALGEKALKLFKKEASTEAIGLQLKSIIEHLIS